MSWEEIILPNVKVKAKIKWDFFCKYGDVHEDETPLLESQGQGQDQLRVLQTSKKSKG